MADGLVKLGRGHILRVVGGACKVCDAMPVMMGYVCGRHVKVPRDSFCSDVVVKRELAKTVS